SHFVPDCYRTQNQNDQEKIREKYSVDITIIDTAQYRHTSFNKGPSQLCEGPLLKETANLKIIMNILDTIKDLFKKQSTDAIEVVPVYYSQDLKFLENHLKEVNGKIPLLEEVYGKDFLSFFYAPGIEKTIRTTFLETLGVPVAQRGFLDNDHWNKKHPFNFPGAFYTGESDSCGTGDREAPFNVLYDDYFSEYIFKQPRNYAELLGVMDAAAVEVFDGYSCNGNEYWTYTACRNWWSNRSDLIVGLYDDELQKANAGREKMYIAYLQSPEAEMDLRKYCYFLEHHCYAANDKVKLPDL
ncbi:hypothetical protein, partial [Chitinophaga sp.]|uniref:hypothetical protein n=1 Tax=Chitinophaga sp. TaxID=1869181 RepID=UPI002F95E296